MTEQLPDERPQRRREYSGAGSTLGIATLIIVAVGVGLWFAEFRDPGSGEGASRGLGIVALSDSLNPTGKPPAAEAGRAAPNFKLESPGRETTQLDSFRGGYVLINFWASWCGPCRSETPDLQALYEDGESNGRRPLTVLGVNQQEEAGTAKKFADQFDVSYPVLLDSSGEVSAAYRVGRGLPVSFLVDPGGVIQKVYLGRLSQEALKEIARTAGVERE